MVDRKISKLDQAVLLLRKVWRSALTFLFAVAFVTIFVSGAFPTVWSETASRPAVIILFVIWATVFGMKAYRRFSKFKILKREWRDREDLELGLLLLVGIYGAVQAAGGLDSIIYPVVFLVIAFLVVYTPQWIGFTLVWAAIIIEASIVLFNPRVVEVETTVVHWIFFVCFALINLIFRRTEAAQIRRRSEQYIAVARAAVADDARDFRLISPARSGEWQMDRQEEAALLAHSSMDQLKGAMYHHVDLLKRTMGLNTCAVLWLDSKGEALRVRECLSDTKNVITEPFDKGEGALGAVIRNQKSLKLGHIRSRYNGLTYYAKPTAVTDFLGVPIIDNGRIRGVLVGDRMRGHEFNDVDVDIFEASVKSLLNIISSERVINQLQKAKTEQGKLLEASEILSRNPSEKEVVKAALDAAQKIVNFEIGVLTKMVEGGHEVWYATGPGCESLLEDRVSMSSSSLVSAAMKNRHSLPYRGEFDAGQQVLLSKHSQKVFSRTRSAMVLPLFSGENPLGALVLTSSEPGLFDDEILTTLQVMSNQLGTVLENARMYQKLEDMATTDGLTGLPNHRLFQDELERRMASAARFKNKLSVVFCDVDKFKGVNDTYGHPVGDMVLRGFAKILKQDLVRSTDMAARYGGEEFAIILEATDTPGALKLANRIRTDLEKAVFHTEVGKLQVTISMGVSTYPDHAKSKEDLVERADIALYAAKEGGRNQVRPFEIKMLDKK